MKDYGAFIERKSVSDPATGLIDIPPLHESLFDFQRDITRWALRRGRAAIFADCGLYKTGMQTEWARHVPGNVLILAPLAVASQTVGIAKANLGIDVRYCRDQSQVLPGITIANYEMLEHFDARYFTGIVLDESSILKSYDGATRTAIIEAFRKTPFRLACTATPAPNDYMELGNHAEFLGVMSRAEMLAMFFVHDGGETQKWRLKGHAESEFWKWLASWAVCIRRPSDLGYDDGDFVLPELILHQITVKVDEPTDGYLFPIEARELCDRLAARRSTIADRVADCAAIINGSFKGLPDENGLAESIQRETQSGLCGGREGEDFGAVTSPTMAEGQSGQAQESAAESIRHQDRGRYELDGGAARQMRDMRVLGHERQEHIPVGGSLPQDGEGSRSTVPELQHGAGQVQGRHKPTVLGGYVSAPQWIVWCNLNSEADAIEKAIPGAVQVAGSDSREFKERAIIDFQEGRISVLVSKVSIFGFGLNLQCCRNMAFVGLSDSYEAFYQAVRRCWRFGQKKPVNVYVITAETEGAVVANIKRKEADAMKMAENMVEHMKDLNSAAIKGSVRERSPYVRDVASGEGWTLHLADCVEVAQELPDNGLHYSIYSPPFASLYTYSNSDRDMGNCRDDQTFMEQYRFLVREQYRATMPGRLTSFHCMNLPTSKQNHGYIGIRDFRGELIRLHEAEGWIFHSEVCIWKDPVTAMQRTKALGLLYKQLRKDSAMSRQGIPDYLVTMRKPGENTERVEKTHESFPVGLWQNYASPVWMDINPSDTLSYREARENNDERHICALQLQVIERGIRLWSNPGDTVFSPFAGIGSEGYVAIKMGRKFLGAELKPSYWQQACKNLAQARREQHGLFAEVA